MMTILIVLWLVSGTSGFIYWWTKEFDFTSEQLFVSVFVSILGPVSWFVGWSIHGKGYSSSKVYIKKGGK
jgi:hypothetical protein